MVVTRELAARGWSVTLIEASSRLGGKAGADVVNGRAVEHGYHIFPGWYRNVRRLLADIGVRLVDFDRLHYLRPRPSRELVTVRNPFSAAGLARNVLDGTLPWYEMFLTGYFALDMLSRPLSQKRLLPVWLVARLAERFQEPREARGDAA